MKQFNKNPKNRRMNMVLSKISLNKLSILIMVSLVSLMVFAGGCKRVKGVLSPGITGFTPDSGMVGDTVTITGKNFSTTAANNTVTFNGTVAGVTSATATQLVVTVPEGATTGKITVTARGLTASSSSDFTVISEQAAVLPAFGGSYVGVISDQKQELPCYWIGTERTDLPIGEYQGGFAISPTVMVGTTVYAAGGCYEGEDFFPSYWVGASLYLLDIPDGLNWWEVNGIAVYNGEVYTVGLYDAGGGEVACYWKGTEGPFDLTDLENEEGWASAVTVSGDTIYISGSTQGEYPEKACYWKITGDTFERVDLPDMVDPDYEWVYPTYATSIAVSDGTVYAAGGYGGFDWLSFPCYWENDDDPVPLASVTDFYGYMGMAHSIAVSGDSVYIGAVESYEAYNEDEDTYAEVTTSWFWKDGERTVLTPTADTVGYDFGA